VWVGIEALNGVFQSRTTTNTFITLLIQTVLAALNPKNKQKEKMKLNAE
jgi:hypothetical protein